MDGAFMSEDPDKEKKIPPPPPRNESGASSLAEVVIRTMASDLDLLGKSGGSVPFGGIPVERIEIPEAPAVRMAPRIIDEEPVSSAPIETPPLKEPRPPAERLFIVIGGILVLIGLFAVGYFIVPRFLTPPVSTPAPTPGEPSSNGANGSPSGAPLSFFHESYFGTPADASINLKLAAQDAYANQALGAVRLSPSGTSFFDAAIQTEDGKPVAWTEFLSLSGAGLLTSGFWNSHFEPDFTAFFYRDKNGVWPGYILKLKASESPILLRSTILKMESQGAELQKLFLAPPGDHASTWIDSQLNGEPVRSLLFSAAGASLSYGFFHDTYFIMSTSHDGLREAVGHL